jgi:uncharacterized protein YdeI (YjbR/CyaY-like superfamily)
LHALSGSLGAKANHAFGSTASFLLMAGLHFNFPPAPGEKRMKDDRVDAYIAKAAPFAQPILTELRARVHKACPRAEETIKWGMPSFVYQGKILAVMAAFKAHATFSFWHREAAGDTGKAGEAMGQFGKLSELKSLPPKTEFSGMLKAAMTLIDAGATSTAMKPKATKPTLETPDDLTAALKRNAAARKTFDAFAPSQRRDYIEWISEAKKPETRERRLMQTLEWLAEGKTRNWKYEKC